MGAPPVLCVGETMWNMVGPVGVAASETPSLAMVPGGAAVEVARALRELGTDAGVASTIGADVLGRALRERLHAEGLFPQLQELPNARTPVLVMFRPEPQRREMASFRVPATDVAPHVRLGRSCRWLHIAALPRSRAAIASLRRVAERACARGARVSLDFNARPRIHADHGTMPPGARRLLALADLVKASEDDLAVVGSDPLAVCRLLARRAVLVVTRGPEPTSVLHATGEHATVDLLPSRRRAADVTGAGDALCAGLIHHLMREARWPAAPDDWRRAVRAGHRAAARRLGARGRPTTPLII